MSHVQGKPSIWPEGRVEVRRQRKPGGRWCATCYRCSTFYAYPSGLDAIRAGFSHKCWDLL